MSLGLNDLKKSARTSKTETKTENWARGNQTTLPWTTSGLSAKGPRARKSRIETSDAFMSAEWANEHTSSLSAFDMEVQSALTQLRDLQLSVKERAVEIERKIKRAAMSPFYIMRSVLTLVQK
jgi:hypothetical protein